MRADAAQRRNELLMAQLPKEAVELRNFAKKTSPQRLATKLVAAGLIGVPGLK